MQVTALKKIWLSSPTMHCDDLKYVTEAYETNWMSTVGKNINEVERIAAEKAEMKYAVALSCCTAALHLVVKHAGETLYSAIDKYHMCKLVRSDSEALYRKNRARVVQQKFWKRLPNTTQKADASGNPCICSPCTGCTSLSPVRVAVGARPTPILPAAV